MLSTYLKIKKSITIGGMEGSPTYDISRKAVSSKSLLVLYSDSLLYIGYPFSLETEKRIVVPRSIHVTGFVIPPGSSSADLAQEFLL